jgi:histidine ammonia-lyase
VDSIPTSGNKEDYVSMGMTAASKLARIVANTRNILAIEAMAAAQALEFLLPLTPGKRGQTAVAAIRKVSPAVQQDRALSKEIVAVAQTIASGYMAEALR